MTGADQAAAVSAVLRGIWGAEWVTEAPRAAGPWLCHQSLGKYILKNAPTVTPGAKNVTGLTRARPWRG
ncbi:hypothetical protein GCM10009594_17000 [Kocuria palustris]